MTLIEVVTVVAVIGVMSVILIQTLKSLTSTQKYAEGQAATLAIGERVLHRINRDLEFAVRVFSQHASSQQLLDAMQLPGGGPLAGSRMPVASNLGYFERDPEERVETGNILFLATGREPFELTVGAGEPTTARIDIYEFVAYYLAQNSSGDVDLQRFCSRPVARYGDIVSHQSPEVRTAIVSALADSDVSFAWSPDEEFGSAFWSLSVEGDAEALGAGVVLPGDVDQTQVDIFEQRLIQVAKNGALHSVEVPAYANATAQFPHGFEVKIDGHGVGQLVLLRLCVMSHSNPAKLSNYAEVVRLVTIKQS